MNDAKQTYNDGDCRCGLCCNSDLKPERKKDLHAANYPAGNHNEGKK